MSGASLTDELLLRYGADNRQALEQLCRYFTRPALANQRVQINVGSYVALKLRRLGRPGTTHLVMSPLEFVQPVQRLACARRRQL